MEGDTLIVATEPHIIHQMEKAMPQKTFIGAPGADGNCNCNICPYMALNTMEKLYFALRDLEPRIEMDEGLRLAGRACRRPAEPLRQRAHARQHTEGRHLFGHAAHGIGSGRLRVRGGHVGKDRGGTGSLKKKKKN